MTLVWGLLLLSIGATVVAQTLLKLGAGASSFTDQLIDRHTLLGVALYAVAAVLYIIVLRRLPVSVALPSTTLSLVGVVLIGHYHLGEPVGAVHIAGVAVICLGVLLLALP
jgi:small multidrug resistance pump